MKNREMTFLGAALVVLGGAGLIFGNQLLASNVLAPGTQTEQAIVVSENKTESSQVSNVGMYSNKEGESYMALNNGVLTLKHVSSDLEVSGLTLTDADSGIQISKAQPTTIVDMSSFGAENPADGNLSEEEAKQIGITAIAQKYGLTQKDIDTFDVAVRGSKASVDSPTVTDIIWVVRLTPVSPEDNHVYMQYHAVIDDKLEEDVYVYGTPLTKEGTPSANELSSDKAIEIGITALAKKYALTQETLDRFTVTSQYYEIMPEAPGKHVWWVNLYPTNTDEFSEIGCYWTYIDAETGEALQLNSAVDGKG